MKHGPEQADKHVTPEAGDRDSARSVSEDGTRTPASSLRRSRQSRAVSITCPAHFTEPKDWTFLAAGIDTLDVGLYVDWSEAHPDFFSRLLEGKLRASGTGGIPFGHDGACLLLPSGKPPLYSFHLQYPEFHLFLSHSPKPYGQTPNAYLSLNSGLLWRQWVPGSLNDPLDVIQRFGGECHHVKPSRVDLCADFLIPGGLELGYLQHCRSPRDNRQRHDLDGDRLETYYVGSRKSPIQLRIYDKGREIVHGGTKYWFTDIWGTETVNDVWRTEYQLRRPVLKEFKVNDCETLLEHLPGMWDYLTTKWISMKDRQADSNISRCPPTAWWQEVTAAGKTFGDFVPVSRERTQSAASIEMLLSQIGGRVSSFAARRNLPLLPDALDELVQLLKTRLHPDWKQVYFEKCIKLGIDPGYTL